MRTKTYHANSIKDLLVKQKIATMAELQTALGTHVNMTVIRKLHELSYHSSYSHRGKYYTLDEIADFDSQGLWSFESVLFSRYGTLMQTGVLSVSVRRGIFFSEHQDCSRPRPLSTTDGRFRSEISMHMGQGGGLS